MDPSVGELELDNLRAIKLLGKGATGTVLLVHDKSRDPSALSPFALKVIPKSSSKQLPRRARQELSILESLSNPTFSHPFLPILLGSFETSDLIGWATGFCPGGDLNLLRIRSPENSFSLAVIKFYLAEILCALDHLHTMGIVYRDLKPENILVKESGHVILTDFDLSRRCTQWQSNSGTKDPPITHTCQPPSSRRSRSRVSPLTRRRSNSDDREVERCYSFVGTEEYVSPEMVCGGPHGFAVDWWALGILAYEMLYGTTPFKGKNKKETYYNILTKRPIFVGRSTALMDLIQRLLEKDFAKRLGYGNGANEIKRHEFFHGVRWELLKEVSRTPVIPFREEELYGKGINVREYFARLKLPESSPSSPFRGSLVKDCQRNISFKEF